MKIGIIGTGNIGSNLAKLIAKAGHEVIISYSRDKNKLKTLALELGEKVKVGTVEEAVQNTNITILSIKLAIMDEVKTMMNHFGDKIIVDTNNPYDIVLPKGVSAAEEVRRTLPNIRLVKAFNSLYFELLLKNSFVKPLTVLPVCSDDKEAKELVMMLIRDIGFAPLDIGGLNNVHLQELNGPLYNKVLTLAEAEDTLKNIL